MPEDLGSRLDRLREASELSEVFARRLGPRIFEIRFALAAFLLPLGIRAIPEVLVGPYAVGWDTIAFYVPNTLDWAAGKVGLLQILGTAPLMYMISVPVYLASRVNPVWIFKIMGPLLYGSMIWALYRFLRASLRWPERRALGGALLASLYFVTLRISWDLYRNMLGLTFILLSLPLLQNWKDPRKELASSILLLLAVSSDQLTAVLALAIVGSRLLWSVWDQDRNEMVHLVRIGFLPAALFGSIIYAGQALGQQLVESQPSVPGIGGLASTVGFLAYIFLPIIPLALVGVRATRNFDLRIWTGFCTLAALVGLLPFYGVSVASYRWALLLDLPVCIFAALGLSRLIEMAGPAKGRMARVLGRALPGVPFLLLLGAGLYIALPAQQAMPYYTAFPGFVPSSMVQDSVPLSDMASLREVLGWVAAQIGPQDALITHQAIYGWARAYLPPTIHIINYGYSKPTGGVMLAQSQGYSAVWTVWWTPGLGWHGQAYLPTGFSPVFQDGDMAVYAYQ